MSYYDTSTQMYYHLWSKYRPAILKLMIDSENDPQEYKFLNHEFKNINPKEKGGYTFVLRIHKGKSLNDIRTSMMARDLLSILQKSKKGTELTNEAVYEFSLDKEFILHITKEEAPAPEEIEEDKA